MGGFTAGAREGVRPCCPLVGLRLHWEGRAPWLLPRCCKEGWQGRGPCSRDRLEGRPGVPDLPTTARPRSMPAGQADTMGSLTAECGQQGGEPGGQGAAVSRTPKLGRREAEGGVSTSRPVPLLRKGAGRRGGGGEEKAAAPPRRL